MLRRPSVRPWQRRAVGACGIALLLAGGLVAGRSSLFAVDRIRVVGESRLGAREVIRLSGIDEDANVLFLDVDAVEHRLEAHPWIREASVGRGYPSTVTIRIVERRPVAAVPWDGRYALVAGDGTGLGLVAAPPPDLPVVAAQRDVPTGGTPLPPVDGPARALAALPPGLRARVETVTVLPDGMLSMRLSSGVRVSFGTPDRAREKARVLGAVLRWARAQHVVLGAVDVRVPAAPAAFEL